MASQLLVRRLVASRQHAFDETFFERWKRRALTGPVLFAVTPAYLALLPATLTAAAASDIARRRPFTATRFAVALGANLAMHVVGLSAVFAAWLAGRVEPREEDRLEEKLQAWWAESIWASLEKLYNLELRTTGDECLEEDGPFLLLSRHASLLDTILPLVVLGGRHNRRLRYVMKRELLWDPVLDAVGHRWPTAFVRRGTRAAKEIEHVAALGEELGAREAIVLFAEGTRFSRRKRQRLIEGKDSARAARASSFEFVLPPHPAGPFALLDAAPSLDVVFCAHTGLEGTNHFEDLLAGSLLGNHVKMAFWRVPRDEIPTGRAERIAWLGEQWHAVDQWIGENRSSKHRFPA